ncbi:hypothetical protein AB0D90_03545 [Streptomyces althioticus]|uniref:hypothetical protein n=1 Tax=Streptomyces althioticus TaxID=83380 RepID=UPI0033CBC7A5
MNAHDAQRALPTQPVDADHFAVPARRGPGDFVRCETATRRVLGYLRPSDGQNLARYDQPETLADPRTVRINPAILDTTIPTTSGTVAAMPLYALARGSYADRSLSRDAAAQYYAELGQVIGYVTVGHNEDGLWVAGALTDPALNEDQLTDIGETAVSADWRYVDGRHELVALYVRIDAALLPEVITRHAVTKGDLLRLLTTGPLADLPDNTLIVMLKDAEGNGGVSPLAELATSRYMPLSTWSGELVRPEDADRTDLPVITMEPVN